MKKPNKQPARDAHSRTTMTEKEAEVLVARLKRIWGCCVEEGLDWHLSNDGFSADLPVHEGMRLLIYPAFWALKRGDKPGALTDSLIFSFETARVHSSKRNDESFALFIAQWLPYFRRGCWLLGCDVEASAYEKAGWIQGFTREEIESWNLKM